MTVIVTVGSVQYLPEDHGYIYLSGTLGFFFNTPEFYLNASRKEFTDIRSFTDIGRVENVKGIFEGTKPYRVIVNPTSFSVKENGSVSISTTLK